MTGIEGLKKASLRIRDAVLEAADPAASVKKTLAVAGREIGMNGRLFLAAAGKASSRMAEAALEALGARIVSGLLVMPHGYECGLAGAHPGIRVLTARHPVPDEHSVRAAAGMLELFGGMDEGDVCLFLLSGGGSSLLCMPHPPLGLEEKMRTTDLLLKSGADITRINTVRKHLSGIKGGRLAQAARGTVVSLIVSDVVGDDPSSIASGPTLPDPTTFLDAQAALRQYGAWEKVPAAVRTHIWAGIHGKIPETPKALPARHLARIVCSNTAALEAASREAAACGFSPRILTDPLVGEAREAGRALSAMAIRAASEAKGARRPACIIAGGETTVTVTGSGRGGRNQETALAAAIGLDGHKGILLTSFATDGVDGVTSAAGAWASGETAEKIRTRGIDPAAGLAANDSYAALSAADELIVTGPTRTNVNDVCFILMDA